MGQPDDGRPFIQYAGPSRTLPRDVRHRRNRYAQLSISQGDTMRDSQPPQPLPIQITFRASTRRPAASRHGERVIEANNSPLGRAQPGELMESSAVQEECSQRQEDTECATYRPQTERRRCSNTHPKSACYGGRTAEMQLYTRISGTPSLPRQDQKALRYFYHFAAVDLSGYLPGRFWDQLVLQISDSAPVVRQILVAVGNAHLDHCAGQPASLQTLSSHHRALRKLREYLEGATSLPYEIVMVCCILLYAFARGIGDQAAASMHLCSSMSILRTARRSTGGRHRGCHALHDVSVMLLQLDIESIMQDAGQKPQLNLKQDIVRWTFTDDRWDLAQGCPSPHDAMRPWMVVAHDPWRFLAEKVQYRHLPFEQVPAHVVAARRAIQLRLRDWRCATRSYIRTSPVLADLELETMSAAKYTTRDIVDVINALIIEAHYFASKRLIAESLQDPQRYKPFDWKPQTLLRTAQRVVALRRIYHAWTNLQPRATFSTHAGIGETLMLLAHRTSFPGIRSQAQSLIQQLHEAQGGLTGIEAFYAGHGAPPHDLVLIYERPGH